MSVFEIGKVICQQDASDEYRKNDHKTNIAVQGRWWRVGTSVTNTAVGGTSIGRGIWSSPSLVALQGINGSRSDIHVADIHVDFRQPNSDVATDGLKISDCSWNDQLRDRRGILNVRRDLPKNSS